MRGRWWRCCGCWRRGSRLRAEAAGQVADAAALAGRAGELGEFAGAAELVVGFVAFAAHVQGGGQVAAQACFGAGEARIHGI